MTGRRYIAFVLLLVIGISAIPGWRLAAAPSRLPHENPADVPATVNYAGLASACWNVLDTASFGDYRDASDLLAEMDVVTLPEEVNYLWERYLSLSADIINILNQQEALLADIEVMIDYSWFSEAERKLNAGRADFEQAHNILGEIRAVMTSIVGSGGIPLEIAQPDTVMARLESSVNEFIAIEERLAKRKEELMSHASLLPEIDLFTNTSLAWKGDDLIATGRITSGNNGLGKRSLILLVNDKPMPLMTDDYGTYSAYIITGTYDTALRLQTIFSPADNDIGVYLPAQSEVITVGIGFYQTSVEAMIPQIIYAGWDTVIKGTVISEGPPYERTVAVMIDGETLATEDIIGDFTITVQPPIRLPEGPHIMKIIAYSHSIYDGGEYQSKVMVSRRLLTAEIQATAISPFSGAVNITGTVYDDGQAVPGIGVRIGYAETNSWIRTDNNGCFKVLLDTPWAFSLLNRKTVHVSLDDYRASEERLLATAPVTTLNWAGILIMLATAAASILLLRRRSIPGGTARSMATVTEKSGPATIPAEPAVAAETQGTSPVERGTNEIVAAYRDAAAVITAKSGLARADSDTPREFRDIVTIKLPAIAKSLADLTTILETVLYSPHRPDAALLATVRQLADEIKRELTL